MAELLRKKISLPVLFLDSDDVHTSDGKTGNRIHSGMPMAAARAVVVDGPAALMVRYESTSES